MIKDTGIVCRAAFGKTAKNTLHILGTAMAS